MKVKRFVDRLDLGDEVAQMVSFVSEDKDGGQAAIQVRPWLGSIEIRSEGREICVPDHAIEPLISALRQVSKSWIKRKS